MTIQNTILEISKLESQLQNKQQQARKEAMAYVKDKTIPFYTRLQLFFNLPDNIKNHNDSVYRPKNEVLEELCEVEYNECNGRKSLIKLDLNFFSQIINTENREYSFYQDDESMYDEEELIEAFEKLMSDFMGSFLLDW